MTTSGIPLSNDDEEVIQRQVPVRSRKTCADDISIVYEIGKTASAIKLHNYKKVALQFPDELLDDATSVVDELRNACSSGSVSLYVLGDTSYGSCCVDEVAAEHVGADVLVHYGRSCLSPTSKLPVIYVFGRLPLSVDPLVRGVLSSLPDMQTPILLVSDTTYMSSQSMIESSLRELGYTNLVPSLLSEPRQGRTSFEPNQAELTTSTLPGRSYQLVDSLSLQDYKMLYIGPPSPTLTTVLMTHSSLVAGIWSFNPENAGFIKETTQNASLRRRYATVQKARDADVIGIVVGTLGVHRYLELIQHIRSLISLAKKKSYLFAVGKLNPAKLANFAEIDVFVLVACGENSLIESRDFYKPIVTPYELSLALGTHSQDAIPWTGDWITDFEKVMSMPQVPQNLGQNEDRDEDAPHFSLVTGKYSSSKSQPNNLNNDKNDNDLTLAKRSKDTAVGMVGGLFSPAAAHLARKEWSGLGTDNDILDDSDRDVSGAKLSQGRSGIARNYEN